MCREYTCQVCGEVGDMNIDGGICDDCQTVSLGED